MSTAQTANTAAKPKHGHRILPRESGAAPLDFVIGVMAFLAALALGGVMIANRTAHGWESGLSGRLTVQILPQGDAAPPKEIEGALRVLRATPGIAQANELSLEENLALVAPWLGRDADVTALPFPALIDVVLAPGQTRLLPTGLKVAIPDGFELQIRPRSGLALKHNLAVLNSPGTIDSDYRGEVQIILSNFGAEAFTVTRGMRICQALLAHVERLEWDVVESLPQSARGAGGFGHTGA